MSVIGGTMSAMASVWMSVLMMVARAGWSPVVTWSMMVSPMLVARVGWSMTMVVRRSMRWRTLRKAHVLKVHSKWLLVMRVRPMWRGHGIWVWRLPAHARGRTFMVRWGSVRLHVPVLVATVMPSSWRRPWRE